MGLKKLLDLSSLYIDSNGCNKSHRGVVLQSPETKIDHNNCFSFSSPMSPNILPKDSMIISSIFVTQEEGRGSQSFKRNPHGDTCRQQNSTTSIRTKSTFNGSSVTTKTNHPASVEVPLSVDMVPSTPATIHSSAISTVTTATVTTSSTSSTSPTTALDVGTSLDSRPIQSKQTSLFDASCQISPDSLASKSESPQSPPSLGSPQSAPNSTKEQPESEPIYAESTKKKRRPDGSAVQSLPESPNQSMESSSSELELSGETQRATITVMAAHTEENNRTFYLSSPDSAVSTQCHFSPTARKDPSSPAFRWPSPSHSAPSLTTEANLSPSLHHKPQSSPPIPPKRSSRSPKLGTSSLSSSMSSPVPLPELPKLGISSLSPSISSPVPLPELPMLFLVSAREGHFKVHTENHSAASERWQKPTHHSSGWNCRIEEEEEEEERERKEGEKKKLATNPTSRVTGLVNGAAVWKEARDWKAHSSPPSKTEPGTAHSPVANNGACQGETEGIGAEEEGKHNGSMPAKQPMRGGSSELPAAGKGSASNDPNPPPPPPKKLHR